METKDLIEDIYVRHVRSLTVPQRLRLLEKIARDLPALPDKQSTAATTDAPTRSIMELRGLGKESWKDVDPQEYINELRAEWDERP